ncbi:MAG TPA: hypothetical protein VK034_10765 [Enhygromyxa sp.]|nr:hypothetical protein [Enhygromyxa sp.]
MISVIACSLGIVTMLALWVLAWWVWRHPDAAIGGQRYRRPIWQNEPTPGPRPVLAPPPSWLFEGGGVPVHRQHPSSSANTSFFSREQLDSLRPDGEQTEILDEDDMLDRNEAPPEPPPIVAPRKTCLYGVPRPGGDR